MKQYRFFFHYNKQNGKMSVHFRKKCYIVDNVACFTQCHTKWNRTQPKVVMQGFATDLVIVDNSAIITNKNDH